MEPRRKLEKIFVAAPCRVSWHSMEGDEKVRCCGTCRQHVYNLSAMEVEEAADVIARNTGSLCVRFYRRLDGTVMTGDCPVGRQVLAANRGRIVRDLATGGFIALTALAFFTPTQGAYARPAARRAALFSAAAQGDVKAVRSLVGVGVSPNSRWGSGLTPLMLAARRGRLETVQELLSLGADPNLRTKSGETALGIAADERMWKVAAVLKKAGGNR
jgi:hypothetical protein